MEGSIKDDPNKVSPCEHHAQAQICTTRASYRQGKEFKAVKVFTINDESQHILIQNVPSIGLIDEVRRLASKHGRVETVRLEKDYPEGAEFTHVYYVKYRFLRDARQAKKRLDNQSFFGNLLHVCYAPEMETVQECRRKLQERIQSVQRSVGGGGERGRKPGRAKVDTRGRGKWKRSEVPDMSRNAATVGTWSNLLPSTASKVVPKNVPP